MSDELDIPKFKATNWGGGVNITVLAVANTHLQRSDSGKGVGDYKFTLRTVPCGQATSTDHRQSSAAAVAN
jgi:hypothetical protein